MKVAVLGTGVAGQALARGFLGLHDEVTIGTRDPGSESARKAGAAVPGARLATFAEAVRVCELAVLATAWSGTEEALRLADPGAFAGKVLIDATNPLDFSAGVPPKLALGFSTSAGEQVQAWVPAAKVVKAFNIVPAPLMVNPELKGGPPTMFIAGDDPSAKNTVTGILDRFGWETIDLGGLEQSRLLEPLGMVFITYAFRSNHWTAAFKLLRG